MKKNIVHTALLAFILLIGSCATKDSTTNKEDDKLHVAKEDALKRIEELKEKYGLGDDSILVFSSVDEAADYNEKKKKWLEEMNDTVYNEDGSIKYIMSTRSDVVKPSNPESFVSISPNPTSSSVTLTFYAGYSAEVRDKVFPHRRGSTGCSVRYSFPVQYRKNLITL